MRFINQDNIFDYAFINMDSLTLPVKAVCVEFHGYTDGRMLTESDAKAKLFGQKGIAWVFPYYSVWAWMSKSSQEFNEQVLDAVYEKLQIPDTIPLIITGGSMGRLTALCYQVYGKRKAVLVNEITKLYEKTYEFELCENLDYAPKGEYVLVVEAFYNVITNYHQVIFLLIKWMMQNTVKDVLD